MPDGSSPFDFRYHLTGEEFKELSRRAAPRIVGPLEACGLTVRGGPRRIDIARVSSGGRPEYGACFMYLDTGCWIDHDSGKGGGIVQLIQHFWGVPFDEAVELACELAQWKPPGVLRVEALREEVARRRLAKEEKWDAWAKSRDEREPSR